MAVVVIRAIDHPPGLLDQRGPFWYTKCSCGWRSFPDLIKRNVIDAYVHHECGETGFIPFSVKLES